MHWHCYLTSALPEMKIREGRVSSCSNACMGTVSVRQEGLRVGCLELSAARDWLYELINAMKHFSRKMKAQSRVTVIWNL